MHTVSFYRRNKNPQSTPVQRIVLNPSLEPHSEVVESPRATITQKIHKLQEEANNQLPVIQQAIREADVIALDLVRAALSRVFLQKQIETFL